MMNDKQAIMSKLQRSFKVSDIVHFCSEKDVIVGNLEQIISNIADPQNVDEYTLDWVHMNNRDPWAYLKKTKAHVVILPMNCHERRDEIPKSKTVIFSSNTMLLFSRISRELFVVKPDPGMHPSAVIHPGAKIGKDVYIGPLCYIGKCEIGDNCIIHSHVSIEDNVTIGNNVLIKNGARIGQPGFGFVKNESGDYEKFPQIGKVVIEDDVEIGANSCIDRGALSDTIICRNAKISDLCSVAHNVRIGDNTIIAGHAMISGSTVLGLNVWVGPQTAFKGNQLIGDGAIIGVGAVVLGNVPKEEIWEGNPSRVIKTRV